MSDAPAAFWDALVGELEKLGAAQSSVEAAIYTFYRDKVSFKVLEMRRDTKQIFRACRDRAARTQEDQEHWHNQLYLEAFAAVREEVANASSRGLLFCGIVVSHVDDLLYGGDDHFEQQVVTPLTATFASVIRWSEVPSSTVGCK